MYICMLQVHVRSTIAGDPTWNKVISKNRILLTRITIIPCQVYKEEREIK